MRHQVVATLLVSLSMGLPSYAAAGIASGEAVPEREAWIERIALAQRSLDAANARYEAAQLAYGQMRHRRRARGERKAAILAEQEHARHSVAEAERALALALEEARRAGVPPGWVREALERSRTPAAPAH